MSNAAQYRAGVTRRAFAKGLAASAVAAGMAGAFGLGGAQAAEGRPDALTIYVGAEPSDGFDPLTTDWGYNGSYILFQSRLLKFNKDLGLDPDLAESWEVSEDKLTYTYHLRQDAKFSDGSPFTADDVVFSYLEARDNGASVIDLTRLADARAVDEHTVEFDLSEPNSSFLNLTGKLGIVPKALYDATSYRENPVGTGPFKLLQWDKGQQIIIAPNEHYYGTKSPFAQIALVFLDGETALANAMSGQFDVVMVSPEYATAEVDGMSLQTFGTIDTRGFNLPTAPLSEKDGRQVGSDVTSDLAIRRALNIGISRQAIVDGALNGIGTPATTLLSGVPWAQEGIAFEDGRADEARQLLDEAGWVEGDDGVRVKDGVRAEFSITGRTDDMQRYNVAVAFAQEAAKLGIKINASSQLWSQCKQDSETIPTCWGTGDYDPSGDLRGYYESTGGYNHAQYDNPEVDAHIKAALDATGADEAYEEWKKVQWDGETGPEGEEGDLPCIWLVTIDHTYFVRDGLDLGDQIVHPHGHGWPVVSNLNEWHWA